MDEFDVMLVKPKKRYSYSELEENKIKELLGTCHAKEINYTLRKMYEVYFTCDAMPGRLLTVTDCEAECAKYGCCTSTAADDAECLINCDKGILDFEPTDEMYFTSELKSIVQKYCGERKNRMTETEFIMLVKEISQELECILKGKELL